MGREKRDGISRDTETVRVQRTGQTKNAGEEREKGFMSSVVQDDASGGRKV